MTKGRLAALSGETYYQSMKILCTRSRFASHTWKDIGGLIGLLFDAVFFIFVLFTSLVMILIGIVAVALNHLFSPVLGLLSMCWRNREDRPELSDFPESPKITTPAATKA
ncbi:MAG: hypothetical protein LV479_13105 [Methylacidiphilales bacterium]|nr:hypothetical protein [Candidatus Methylacidiphilales bacterium]